MFWKRKKESLPPLFDYSLIGTDVHSHLLPGIDDGSGSMTETLDLLRGLKDLGYKKVITTPHNQAEFYINPPEKIREKLNDVREAAAKANIDIEIDAASEYFFDYDFLDKVRQKNVISFGDNYLLFELSPTLPPTNFETIVFEIQLAGFTPVLAHPERYGYFHTQGKYQELTEKGLLLQVNIHSLSSMFANNIRNAAIRIIEDDLYSFAGSDTHSASNLSIMKSLLSNNHIIKMVRSGRLLNKTL